MFTILWPRNELISETWEYKVMPRVWATRGEDRQRVMLNLRNIEFIETFLPEGLRQGLAPG